MKKILFLIPNLSRGGAEKVLVNLVNNLNPKKYEISVTTLFDVGVNKKALKPHIRYNYVFKKQLRGNSHLFKLFSPRTLFKYCIKEKYDIIVSYLEGPTARIVSGCPDSATKLVSWIHVEMHNTVRASKPFRSAKEAKRCYDRFDMTVFVSETVKKDFTGIFDLRNASCTLYNTNETAQIIKHAEEPVQDVIFDKSAVNICSVGRLVEQKGFMRLASIHKRLIDSNIPNRVYILGVGSEQSKIEDFLKKNSLTDSFIFLGYNENPYKYVKNCDLFVCSSLREGFSTAVTESLIVGTPVVTTLCSGMEEMLGQNNEYGIITENSEDALFEGIKRILTEDGLLHHYKSKAFQRGLAFNTEATAGAVEKMLDSL